MYQLLHGGFEPLTGGLASAANRPDSEAFLRTDLARQPGGRLRWQVSGLFSATVAVSVQPTDASLTIDGVAPGLTSGRALRQLGYGPHVVAAGRDGYLAETRTVNVRGGETLFVRLVLKRRIRVLVLDALTGEAVGAAQVTFNGRSYAASEGVPLVPGTHQVRVAAQGYLPIAATVTAGSGPVAPETLLLERGMPQVTLVVREQVGGAAIPGAYVRYRVPDGEFFDLGRTNQSGELVTDELPEGEYQFETELMGDTPVLHNQRFTVTWGADNRFGLASPARRRLDEKKD
jgi:hypothetical protein